jgi:hypothetical protein
MPVERLLSAAAMRSSSACLQRLVEIADLGKVVEQPVAGERSQLGILELARQRDHLLTDAAPLRRVVDVQKRGVAAHQGRGERRRLGQPPRHVERFVGEHQGPPLRLGEDESLGEPRQHSGPERAVAGPRAARTWSSRSA